MGTVASYPSALNYAVSVQSTSSIFFFHLFPKRLCFLPVLSPSLVFFFFFHFMSKETIFPSSLLVFLWTENSALEESQNDTQRGTSL